MRGATQAHHVSVHILPVMSETRGQQQTWASVFMIFCLLLLSCSERVDGVYVSRLNISQFSMKAL